MILAYTGATVTSCLAGAVAGYLANDFGFRVEYDQAVLGTWLIVTGLPAAAVASSKALRTLGQKPQTAIVATSGTGPGGYNLVSNGRGGYNIFQSTIDLFSSPEWGKSKPEPESARRPELPSVFTVENLSWSEGMDPITIQFSEGEVLSFLETVWSRQTSDDSSKRRYPFSRNYFTIERRPAMDSSEYHGLISLLSSCNLICNRTQGKSGKLSLAPKRAIHLMKWAYGLA